MSQNLAREITLKLENIFEEMSEDLDLYVHLRRVFLLRLMKLLNDIENALIKQGSRMLVKGPRCPLCE
jgi:hypothetical protein